MAEYKSASSCFLEAKAIFTDPLDKAVMYHNYAYIYDDLGKFERALFYYEKAQRIIEKIFGTDCLAVGKMYNNI
ncbi:MAG: tetratricopeptide repeat protein [Oscillospiraceae bacterium]|nr:tetratricopeptide repeat protein [Oscillospiraceae bacterium]